MILNNLVFSGGSIRAIGYVGCFKALEEYNLMKDIHTLAGTSAGGIIELPSKKRIKNASKIVNELYNRYNEEDRSLKDKQYIKNLLDWY